MELRGVLASAGSWSPRPGERVDLLRLTVAEAIRPRGRWQTSDGREIVLSLPRGTRLHDGDLLFRGEGFAIAVLVEYPAVVEVRLPDLPIEDLLVAAMDFAHFVGNRHLPLRVLPGGVVRIPADNTEIILRLLEGYPLPLTLRVVPGEREDPLPNPEAHLHG